MAYCSSYYLYQRYEKRGDQDWIPSYPNVYSIDGEGSKPLRARQMYDTDCGWIPDTEPIYRWTEIAPTSDPNSYWCDNCSSLYANQPFTIIAHNEDITVTMVADTSEVFEDTYVSTDKGQTWTFNGNTDRFYKVIPANTSLSVKGMIKTYLSSFKISGGTFDVEGNIMSLVSDNWESIAGPINFQGLFSGHTNLISAENLVLPATNLSGANYCYRRMFKGCGRLTKAPSVLPATTLSQGCYDSMFDTCISLIEPPVICATTMATSACASMFKGCGDLTTAPELPATTLEEFCYSYMFYGCTSLATPPELPATTLADWCYYHMFENCGLTSVPSLPATTLAGGCYCNMFKGCGRLTTIPSNLLPATTLAGGCYNYMFYDCTSLTTTLTLPATTMKTQCYFGMFYGCRSLTTPPALPATTLAEECYMGMFTYCTGLTSLPVLSATTLAKKCYAGMYKYCSSITTIPSNYLPATTLAPWCYYGMFYGCSNLTTVPSNLLPATTLDSYCYANMFESCDSLTTVPSNLLPATTLKETCYAGMFNGCSGLTTAPVLSAATLVQACYQWMFQGCSSLNYVKCLATNISATDCTDDWLYGVASSGTFVKSCNNYSWATGASGIPSNWNVNCEGGSYESQYLTFVALESGTFRFSGASSTTINNSSIQYSLNNGSTWTTLNRNAASPTVQAGSKIMWKATFLSDYGVGIGRFNATGRYNIEGNIMSLLYGSNFVNNSSLSGYDYAFTGLFRGTSVVSAANLILPARTLRLYCYSTMFYGCSLLTSAPALPATTAADECYQSMFQNCTSLTTAPDLNTTNMGWGSCSWMFAGCTALTTPPALPATTMNDYCYQYMFSGCTSLTTSPTLPASTLVYMCYDRMFYGCRNLNYVRCYANTIAESSTIEWLYKVKSTGTFVKSPTMNSWERGNSGIPSGWTIQNA